MPGINTLISDHFDEREALFADIPVAESLKDLTIEQVIEEYRSRIEELAKERFKGRELNPDEMKRLRRIVAEALLRVLPSDFTTGIVVAGFGSKQTFPAVYALEVDGRVCGKLKFSDPNSSSIEASPDGGQIIYFAQTDVIQRLLD